MTHGFSELFKHDYLSVNIILLLVTLFWLMLLWWQRQHRPELVIGLDSGERGDDRLTITVINKSRKEATIQKIDLDISSEDLNRGKREQLKELVELRNKVDEQLGPGQSATFDLHHRSPNRDELYPLRFAELVSDLHDLGVEIAELGALVVDDKGQFYASNTLRIPVYQLVAPDGHDGLRQYSLDSN